MFVDKKEILAVKLLWIVVQSLLFRRSFFLFKCEDLFHILLYNNITF